jgi:hypothetical protein
MPLPADVTAEPCARPASRRNGSASDRIRRPRRSLRARRRYVIGSLNTHRDLAGRISRAASARVLNVDLPSRARASTSGGRRGRDRGLSLAPRAGIRAGPHRDRGRLRGRRSHRCDARRAPRRGRPDAGRRRLPLAVGRPRGHRRVDVEPRTPRSDGAEGSSPPHGEASTSATSIRGRRSPRPSTPTCRACRLS